MNSSNIDPRNSIDRSPVWRAFLLIAVMVACFGLWPTAMASGLSATVITISQIPGSNQLSVGVAIPKWADTASRTGQADWGLIVTVTYLSTNNKIVTVPDAPVRLSIRNDTQLIGPVGDSNLLVAESLTISYGTNDPPGGQPSYSGTAELLPP